MCRLSVSKRSRRRFISSGDLYKIAERKVEEVVFDDVTRPPQIVASEGPVVDCDGDAVTLNEYRQLVRKGKIR